MNPYLFIGVALVAAVLFIRMKSTAQSTITPKEASAAAKSGAAVIIDVREAPEWAAGVAEPAVLLPLSDLKGPRTEWGPFLEKNHGKQLVVYCQAGMRAGTAASILKSEGFEADNLGGFPQWVAAGLSVRKP